MSLRRKIQIGLLILLALFVVSAAVTFSIVEQQRPKLDEVSALNAKVDSLYTKLEDNTRTMELNIVQVQQFLSNLGATRGLISQKNTDEDYKDAEENAQSFMKLASESRSLAEQAGEKELVKLVDDVRAAFPAYYDTGKEMAQAYIANGAEAGNKLMPTFDEASESANKFLKSSAYTRAARRLHTQLDARFLLWC